MGLLTSYRGNPHRYKFETNHLSIHRIAKGQNDSDGPDIGLIVLPQEIIGRLKAEKSFFNIDRRRDRFNTGFIPIDRGFWFTLGFPGVFEFDIEPNRGFAEIKGYYGLCGISGIGIARAKSFGIPSVPSFDTTGIEQPSFESRG